MNTKILQRESGFTIVELMIATVVFSLILVVLTAGVISFSNQYYRSVNTSATQGTARSVIDTVSQAVQFGSGDVVGVTGTDPNTFFCAGGYVFAYQKAVLYTGGAPTDASPGLYMQPKGAACAWPGPSFSPAGKQLLSKNQQVTQISVVQSGDLYSIVVGIAFGERDVICTTNAAVSNGGCNGGGNLSPANMWNNFDELSCRSGPGAPYCAISILKTVVEKRL